MTSAQLVVVLGRPGTGKTTLARALTQHLHATYLCLDTISASAAGRGFDRHPVEALAHAVADGLARENLGLHVHTVLDGVSASHAARSAWTRLADESGARITMFETFVPNLAEWQRRVESRPSAPDAGARLTWEQVRRSPYAAWDDRLDGLRVPVDMTDTGAGIRTALQRLP